jgi:nitronate monooxygenase
MFKTRFTEMFGVEHPIMQGALGYLSKAELASAVCNAGGLGTLATAGIESIDELRDEIRKTRALTDKPFAANLPMLPGRMPISHEQMVEVFAEEGVPIVETVAMGPIPGHILNPLKQSGIRIIHKCTKVKHAQSAEQQGVDAVAMLGFGADGHPGPAEITHLVQVPQAVEKLGIPVIAAGGIADARGFVASLALGADAVLMGTRFLTAQECSIHPRTRERLLQAEETDTVLVNVTLGLPGRSLKTKTALDVLELEKKGAPPEEILRPQSGRRAAKAWTEGDVDGATLGCGQVIGLVHEILTAQEIVDGIISEARGIIDRLESLARGAVLRGQETG